MGDRPITSMAALRLMREGWRLVVLGSIVHVIKLYPPEGSKQFSKRVHKGAYRALSRQGLIEAVPGQEAYPSGGLKLRLTKSGRGQ